MRQPSTQQGKGFDWGSRQCENRKGRLPPAAPMKRRQREYWENYPNVSDSALTIKTAMEKIIDNPTKGERVNKKT